MSEVLASFTRYREDWMESANCKGKPTRWWFPEHADGGDFVRDRKTALKLCGLCRVRADCLQYGINTSSSGIWGGVTLDRGNNRKLGIRVSKSRI